MRGEADDSAMAHHVLRVLLMEWDPMSVLMLGGPQDAYDGYVPALVSLTGDSSVFEDRIIAHLARLEREAMCISLMPEKRTRAARALLGLREACLHGNGKLVEQRTSTDGIRCLWIFETPGPLYAYEQGILRHEDDENGRYSWWADAGPGRSGLFGSFEEARREACLTVEWLRDNSDAFAGEAGAAAGAGVADH